MASEFDEIEAFLQSTAEEADIYAIVDAARNLDTERYYDELTQVMVAHGLPAVHYKEVEPEYVDPTPIDRIRVTSDDEAFEGVSQVWEQFAHELVFAKGFCDYGSGPGDPFAVECGQGALEATLLAEDLDVDTKQVGITIAKEYLDEQTFAGVLQALGNLDPTDMRSPIVEAQLAVMQQNVEEITELRDLNCAIRKVIRPILEAVCSTLLPPTHDDFKQLVTYVEIIAKDGINSLGTLDDSDSLEQRMEALFEGFLGDISDRHDLLFSDVKNILHFIIAAYVEAGYTPV